MSLALDPDRFGTCKWFSSSGPNFEMMDRRRIRIMRRMLLSSSALVAVSLSILALPAESQAQRYGRGFGGGRGGVSIGFGNYGYGGYGRGFGGYPGLYGPGYGRSGISVNIGRGFGNYGYGSGYNSGYYSAPAVVYSDPSVQNYAFYPPQDSTGIVQASAAEGAAGMVVLYVPANAQVWWGGTPTTTAGVERRFATPPLPAQGGVETFQAQWVDANGQTHNETRQIQVMPGQTVALDFRQPAATNNVSQQGTVPNQAVIPNRNPVANPNIAPAPNVPNPNLPNRNVNPDDLPPEPFNR
jgi:uncharacterized protein (TIGR03000 family)